MSSAISRRALLQGSGMLAIAAALARSPHAGAEHEHSNNPARQLEEVTGMTSSAKTLPSGANDFDFLHGSWRVSHQRLAQRLKGSTDWVRFGGTMTAKPILGGLGNFDENVLELPQGAYQACTVRLFNPQQARWSIYWIDGRDPKLDEPVHGTFSDGVGTFYNDDVFEGRPVRTRFLWSQIKARSARWEQALSADGGASWETNWIMEFERV